MNILRPGMKVCCIDDEFAPGDFYDTVIVPAKGQVYTVREVFEPVLGFVCIRLVEIVNAAQEYQCGTMEPGFMVGRFRPVVEHKSDISIFNAMLNPSKVPA